MTEPITAWLIGEVFDLGLPPAMCRVLRRRGKAAREILQDQLSRLNITIADASDRDEAAAMVFEYADAARRGAGRRNLLMLAQVMAGQLETSPVYASHFLRWSRVVADLSVEDVIVIAELHREFHSPPNGTLRPTFTALESKLAGISVVCSGGRLDSILQGLIRTGFVIRESEATGGTVVGDSLYLPSARLNDLMTLIRIEDVVAEPER